MPRSTPWRAALAEIRIHREHDLGLKKAREIAWAWAEQVEQKFDMECTVHE
ncbi:MULTISPECIES: polyhydroxyalkanoic acid system family protein, partial [Gammaproteobacteria]|uniref:polyhydroxyalkanoic acid system family protein n=1 Tax=Gammaproteobacteria TaxID=1236 RepID=UPI001D0EA7F7